MCCMLPSSLFCKFFFCSTPSRDSHPLHWRSHAVGPGTSPSPSSHHLSPRLFFSRQQLLLPDPTSLLPTISLLLLLLPQAAERRTTLLLLLLLLVLVLVIGAHLRSGRCGTFYWVRQNRRVRRGSPHLGLNKDSSTRGPRYRG